MLGHELRYSPYFQKVKALVDADEIGAPRSARPADARLPGFLSPDAVLTVADYVAAPPDIKLR